MACEPEGAEVNLLPPLLGFGDTTGVVSVAGEILEVNILLTAAMDQDRDLAFNFSGDGVGAADIRILTPSPLRVPAGSTEVQIQLQVAELADPSRLDRRGVITLEDNDWFRLSERQFFYFGFSVPHTAAVELWTPDEAFPKLYGYTSFGPEPVPEGSNLAAGEHFAFAYSSRTEPNVIGMYNEVPGRSTNALNLHRVYADYEVSTGSANIRIPRLFRLIPDSPGATFGQVEVIEQRITIVRRASSGLPPFEVGLSGSGTYDEVTGTILVTIIFDETELGLGDAVVRRYAYESEERP